MLINYMARGRLALSRVAMLLTLTACAVAPDVTPATFVEEAATATSAFISPMILPGLPAVTAVASQTLAPSHAVTATLSATPSETNTPVPPLATATPLLNLPPGFTASVMAKLPPGWSPTSITFSPDGRLFAASIPTDFSVEPMGKIWVFKNGKPSEYAADLLLPAGIAFQPGTLDLYVSHRASNVEGQITKLAPDGKRTIIVGGLSCCYSNREHQPNGIAFSPSGILYLALGGQSDHGERFIDPMEGGILRISPDGLDVRKYADGMRNPYDLAFDSNGQLWATDNGADFGPPEELNRVIDGGHYGWPYYENCDFCPAKPEGLLVIPPYADFIPHSTPVGLTAYTGGQFPPQYFDNIFVALWNPSPWSGIVRVTGENRYETFATGMRSPIDIVVAPDGALSVAEFWSGIVYRIAWLG